MNGYGTRLACFLVAASSMRSFAAPLSMNFVIPPASATWRTAAINHSADGVQHATTHLPGYPSGAIGASARAPNLSIWIFRLLHL